MNQFGGSFAGSDEIQAGSPALVAFFNAVYGWMAAGLGVTAVVAWLVAHNLAAFQSLVSGPGLIILFVAEIVLVMVVAGAVQRISATVATALFLAYAALNGITLSGIFLVYEQTTIAGAFLVTAVTFGAMSLYGMVTQRDLTRWGSLLFMALIGLIVASVVNIFFASSALYALITYGGVLIFVGLTAYDTQRLKYMAVQTAGNGAAAARYSIVGALVLYLDFINLFLLLLRLLGNSNRRN
ncbi:MAG TPA: Bax inhibitor-1/YccA family protein [Tepidisphaeraceae bacterium]|nr:Bax inhibitor-1/YccA family protein [Tepidisphaeraceae bacterium]